MNHDRRPPTRRAGMLRFVVALLCFGILGCGSKSSGGPPRVAVTVSQVEQRAMPHEIEATGTVEPQQTVEVLAQVGGTVQSIAFREGDAVRAGQVLIQLDARPFRAALDQAQAALARDDAQADRAKREAERARSLVERGLISAEQHDEKQSTAAALAATVRGGSAAAAQAGLNLQYATIRAPISGRTGRLGVHVGDVVRPSDTANPLVIINQMSPVRVRFTVPQDAMPAVLRGRGRSLRVLISPADRDSFEHAGRLVFVDNAVDPASGTLTLKGEFDNQDEGLWPGEFVRVRLVLASEDAATVIPAVAVTAGPSGTFVYVVGPDSTVSVRPVVVQRTRDDMAVIARGVEPGEVVVTDGQLRLGPGARVMLRPGAGESTAATPGGGSGAGAAAGSSGGGH